MTEDPSKVMVKVEVVDYNPKTGKGAETFIMPEGVYKAGDIVPMNALLAAQCIREGSVKNCDQSREVSAPFKREMDPLERAIRDKDFEAAKMLAAQQVTTNRPFAATDPAQDPVAPIAPVMLPDDQVIPGTEIPSPGQKKK